MPIYKRIELTVEAERYGSREGGEWFPGCDQVIAKFLLGYPPQAPDVPGLEIYRVLRPRGVWDPPSECTLLVTTGEYHQALRLGDWVVSGPDGYRTWIHEDFTELFELADG